jgi:hypothetical protein
MTAAPKHTSEPWEIVPDYYGGKEEAWGHWHKIGPLILCGKDPDANGLRVAACVNALAGLNPAAVPALVEACSGLLDCLLESHRDEIETDHHGDGPDCSYCDAIREARAALSAVRGTR